MGAIGVFSQNAVVGTGFSSGWGGGSCPSGNTDFSFMGNSDNGTFIRTTTANNTGHQYFRFGVDWSGTTKQLTITPGSDDAVSPNLTYNLNASCVVVGAMYVNVPNASYNYVFKTLDGGTDPTGRFVLFEVQGDIRTVTAVTQVPQVVLPTTAVTITATTDGLFNPGQAAYLRYAVNDDWNNSVVQKMTFSSGTDYVATIPAMANGTNIKYYVFTSGDGTVGSATGPAANGSDAPLRTINLNNNNYSNYQYDSNVAGLFSAKVYLRTVDWTATRYYNVDTNLACDPGVTSNWENVEVARVEPESTINLGGNIISYGGAAWSNQRLFYRMYLDGFPTGTFTSISLSAPNTVCNSGDIKHESLEGNTTIAMPSQEGIYVLEVYFQARRSDNTEFFWSNFGQNYKARIQVKTHSNIFESYAFINLNDVTTFYNLDGANGSSNPDLPANLGTFQPGLVFKLGAEQKIYSRNEHQVCECSVWYSIYDDDDGSDPTPNDFPLPPAGAYFDSDINEKFIRASNLSFLEDTGTGNSTGNGTYDGILNGMTRKQKFQNIGAALDTQINFPDCIGTYRFAIANLAAVSTTGDCNDTSSYRYIRDINEDLKFLLNTSTDVILNPKRPNQTISSNDYFYTTKITIGDTNTRTWDGLGWDAAPNRGSNVIFTGDYTASPLGLEVNSITIQNAITVTIPNNTFIKAFNDAETFGTGKLSIAPQGNFIQVCEKVDLKKPYIELLKNTRMMRKWDYVYWGKPIVEDVFTQIPIAFDKKYYWQSGVNATWVPLAETKNGEGFITRVKVIDAGNPNAQISIPFEFKGTANNGLQFVTVTPLNLTDNIPANTALLANPYPGAIDAETFLRYPGNNKLGGTLYFWTSTTPYPGIGPYQQADYASWNLTGATGTQAPNDSSNPSELIPDGSIASGQGFFAEIKQPGTIVFANSMRTTDGNEQFFRTASPINQTNTASLGTIEKHRFWLSLRGTNSYCQLLLGYVDGATNGLDRLYDGNSLSISPNPIYSIVEGKKLGIQGRSLPFTTSEIIPLGIKTTTSGTYQIVLDAFDGLFEGSQTIYLEDQLLNVVHNLKLGAYSFATTAGVSDARFRIRFVNEPELTVPNFDDEVNVLIFSNDGIHVKSATENMKEVVVYDVLGKQLYKQNASLSNAISIMSLQKQNQVLLVRVELESGKVVTEKVIH
ncbi:hypothetical protein GCM10011343_06450 [Flavobacterium orientale]|uniref:Por secretion system C-terminal sorting domain-containing protein n=1 Tax=Flavobacterium orientale TaxID=1756020 RepID=A0A917DAJ7_9FLAO|nr:hypothetical protein GCM10011343_06450 [Flavobacterium orientale]